MKYLSYHGAANCKEAFVLSSFFLQCPQYWYLPIKVNTSAKVKISKQPNNSGTGILHERTVLIYENTIRTIFCLLI